MRAADDSYEPPDPYEPHLRLAHDADFEEQWRADRLRELAAERAAHANDDEIEIVPDADLKSYEPVDGYAEALKRMKR
jgi:hypothetical protein